MQYRYMPISISLTNTECLVVGGGKIALRKIETLFDYGARVTVIAPKVHDKIKYYAEKDRLKLEQREYVSPEAGKFRLVISASDSEAVNEAVYEDTRKSGSFANVVDNPDRCDFAFPAVLRRNCLSVAVSTDGKAPFLAAHLRAVLENIFPSHWERLARLAAGFRDRVLKTWPNDPAKRHDCFAAFLNSDWKQMFDEMNDGRIEAELQKMVNNPPFSVTGEEEE
jgi:siroheme synthase-like protein